MPTPKGVFHPFFSLRNHHKTLNIVLGLLNVMVKYLKKQYKTALNKLKYPDSWFWCRYTINPYSGCEHACIYCDARSNRYYLEQDFENEVIIKVDLDKILEKRLKNARSLIPDVVGPGGVCDGYQQVEKKAKNTRKILKVFLKYQYPVNIATKNSLITRDIDVLKRIASDTWCTVGFSITTVDDELAKFLEPFSSTPSERLDAIKTIKKEAPNIQVGTYFMPIIPFLEDLDENLEGVIKKSKESGADFLLFSPGLTMRDSQEEFFLKKLRNSKYKDVVKPLKDLFKGKVGPPVEYVRKKHLMLYKLCKKHDLSIREKRWIPKDYRKWNYKVSEKLLNEVYHKMVKTGKQDNAMMWAGLNLNNLEESIMDVYKRGDLTKIKNFTKKVRAFLEPYLEKNKDKHVNKGLDRFL